MSPSQKANIQKSWRQVVPIADQAATLFYDRLFTIDPDLRALFADVDMSSQRKRLVDALAMAVDGLDRVEELIPTLEAQGIGWYSESFSLRVRAVSMTYFLISVRRADSPS